jgi:uncharacterized membrane protein
MTTFTVWKFDSPEGAEHAIQVVEDAAKDGLVTIVDHAVVSWPHDAEHPKTKHSDGKHGAAWGALWGIVAGALFTIPVAGAVAGAAIGAMAKATNDAGITKADLEKIRTEVVPGTSALFIVTDRGDLDRLGERFSGTHAALIHTNLTEGERKILMETFGGGA